MLHDYLEPRKGRSSQRSGSVQADDANGDGGIGRRDLHSDGDRDTVWDDNGAHIYDTIASPNQTGSQAQPRSIQASAEIHADLEGHVDTSVFSADEFSNGDESEAQNLEPSTANSGSHGSQHGENSLLHSRQEGPLESNNGSPFPAPPSQSVLEAAAIEGSPGEAERNSPENRRVDDPLDQILVHEQEEEHKAMVGEGSDGVAGSPLESAPAADERDSARQRKERRRAGRFSPLCREEGVASPDIKRSPESENGASGDWEA